MLENSLKNLGAEYIDLYMIHWPDKNIDIRKPMEYLSRAKEYGTIRTIGLCNTSEDAKARFLAGLKAGPRSLPRNSIRPAPSGAGPRGPAWRAGRCKARGAAPYATLGTGALASMDWTVSL